MEEIIETGTEIFDALKDFNGQRLIVKGRDFVAGHGRSKFLEGIGGANAKKANKVPLIIKGADVVIDVLGIDRDNDFRNRLGRTFGTATASDILPPDDTATAQPGATDQTPHTKSGDTMLTGQIDP